ncbi:MAG: hypothetical protein ACM3SS_21560 [Rhodospirillaceae bacterium]
MPAKSASSSNGAKKESVRLPNTGMKLWIVRLRDPRHHRERKVWVTEVIAMATTEKGAELVVRRQQPTLFAYDPNVTVERVHGHTVKHLTYQADPMADE